MAQTVLLISSQKPLVEELSASCRRRGARFVHTPALQDSPALWSILDESLAGVVADSRSLRERERWFLFHRLSSPHSPRLLFLDPPQATYPTGGRRPIRRLVWSLDEDFLDQVAFPEHAPAVFLADPTLFLTGLLHERLQMSGLWTMVMDSASGLDGILNAASEWTLEGTAAGRAIVLGWSGDAYAVEAMARGLWERAPAAELYIVESRAPLYAAEQALRRCQPAFLPRRLLEPGLDLLLGKPAADPTRLGRILLVDGDKEALAKLSAGLMADGFEVSACLDAGDAMDRALTGHFHAAVIAAEPTDGGLSERRFVENLRALDSDLKLVFLLRQRTTEEAVKGMSQAVEVGLDDCLLKPVEPDRLIFSLKRTLDRRYLSLENQRIFREVSETNRRLAQLTGFQQKFFAAVVHDLKNPLMGIAGFADILGMRLTDEKARENARGIRAATKALDSLLSDLVDLAAIETGKLRVEKIPVKLGELARELAGRIGIAARERGIDFRANIPEELPSIPIDPQRIAQALQNLCTNALQYTPKGGAVELEVEAGGESVGFRVRDTGIGISKEDLPKVFQNYFQTRAAQSMRGAGFGLGLKIAQEIIRAHGGSIRAESELGKGSIFRFELPLPR